MRNTIIQSISNNNTNKKKYNSINIYQMNFQQDLSILMKPVVSGASIIVAKAALQKGGNLMTNIKNLSNADYALAGGVAGGFLVAKLAGPYIEKQLHLGTFFGALENRVVEVGSAGAVLYGMDKAKVLGPIFPSNQGDIVTTALIIVIADMLGEEAPRFFGISK